MVMKKSTSVFHQSVRFSRDSSVSPRFTSHVPEYCQNQLQTRHVGLFSYVTPVDRWLVKKMLDVVGNPPVSLKLWDGTEISSECSNPVAELVFGSRLSIVKTLLDPELHWGDYYCKGHVQFKGDMVRFLELIYRGISQQGKPGILRRLVLWVGHRRIVNSHARSRENIHHHYDIGNRFYQLWLDNTVMQYTCAYFYQQNLTLEQAQLAKLHHVCRKLRLKPGEYVVEAGCGWGGLALFMARHYGVNVRAYNISREQVAYARQRARDEGMEGKVEYILDDYRNIRGQYDAFISVGMLEHVGPQDYRTLGEVIRRCMKPEGRGLVHSIGKVIQAPMNAWIERRIFPGAYAPTLSEMMQIFEPVGLAVQDVENLRLHYSKTLECWLQRFEQNRDAITAMMDETFVRAWYLYLAGSIASFNVGELQLFQVVFTHLENNQLPGSRAFLYEDEIKRAEKLKDNTQEAEYA